jgi:antitoxin (DNA-binding transcriptional repressor) of toxin-antitoxin stability system
MVTKKVRIADLESRLSEYLRAVRRGDTITVLDRQTPVAQIVLLHQEGVLRVHEPAPGTPTPNRIPPPEPLNMKIDIVELLLDPTSRPINANFETPYVASATCHF